MGDMQVAGAARGLSTPSTSSLQPTVTGSATAHTKGSWTVLLADTAQPVVALQLMCGNNISAVSNISNTLVDIGIAPVAAGAGTETVVVPNILCGGRLDLWSILLPIQVPAGYRISARLQSQTVSKTTRLGVITIPKAGAVSALEGVQKCSALGVDLAGSRGVTMVIPAAINTESAWAVLSASIPHAARWLVLCVGAPNTATASDNLGSIDVGVGAIGAESLVLENVPFRVTIGEDARAPYITVPAAIPAGSRLVVRHSSATTATTPGVPEVSALIFG